MGRTSMTRDDDRLRLPNLLAERLGIELPPVGMAFVDAPPPDVPQLYAMPPSFCSLWRMAELRAFYADAERHGGCGIGDVVSGFGSGEGREDELAALFAELCEAVPDGGAEMARTARFALKAGGGAVYGPLWKMPIAPDLALMWATLPQMGVIQEIVGSVMWRENPQGATFTRPACAVLPIAHRHRKPALSLGCVGMRIYTETPPTLFLLALPPDALPALADGLETKPDIRERLAHYAARLRGGA